MLSLPATAVGFSLSVQVAALSWILNTKYNLHIEDVALVWLAGPLSGIIAQPIVGLLSDKSWFWGGRRKPFIIIGGLLGSAMLLALPQIDIISQSTGLSIFTVAIIVSLLLDMNVNVTMNPARSIIADVTPPGKERARAYTIMQLISGSFGVGAYFISIIWGNIALIYLAAILVLLFSLVPVFLIEEPRVLESYTDPASPTQVQTTLREIVHVLEPLYGFILFALFVMLNKILLNGALDIFQNGFMYFCLILTGILGISIFVRGRKRSSDTLEFKKILLAHAFTWLGVQSMFVMSFFYIKEKVLPALEGKVTMADQFSNLFSQNTGSIDQTTGSMLSLGLLLLNLVGAILPVLALQPLSRRFGIIKVYTICIGCMAIGYFILYLIPPAEWIFYLCMLICGIGWAAAISIIFAIISEKIPAQKMGIYMGVFNFSVVLPAMMTAGLSKAVANSGDFATMFLYIGISLLISFVAWLFVKRND